MRESEKILNYWKIQEKIDNLTIKKDRKLFELQKINEKINELKDLRRKYE